MPRPWTLLLIAAGCTNAPTEEPIRMAELDEARTPVDIEVVPTTGVGTVAVPLRLVNAYGAAIPGTSATVGIQSGSQPLGSQDVSFDAFGYALARVTPDAPSRFTVTVTGSADGAATGAQAEASAVAVQMPTYKLGASSLLPENGKERTFTVNATGGAAVALGDEIWFAPLEPGIPAHRVAILPDQIAGMESAHIDSDGVLDLVAWAGDSVVMLRGRSGGGYAWGAGWQGLDGDIAGTSSSDLNGDRLTDVAIAITSDTVAWLLVLEGDGTWGFTPSPSVELTFPVMSLTAWDEAEDGRPDLTVISSASGTLRRFTLDGEDWVGGSTPEISAYNAQAGSRLLPQVDIQGDGDQEIVVVGAPEASSQDLVFLTLGELVTQYPQAYGLFHAAAADMDGNGSTELMALEDSLLHVTRWEDERASFVSKNVTGVGDGGPISAQDVDGDGVGDVLVGREHLDLLSGRIGDDTYWTLSQQNGSAYSMSALPPAVVTDLDGDSYGDLVAFTLKEGAIVLGVWRGVASETGDVASLVLQDSAATNVSGDVHDLVVCDSQIYGLIGTGDTSTLLRFTVDTSSGTWAASAAKSAEVVGTLLSCGTTPTGPEGVVVASTTGSWSSRNQSLVEKDSGELGAVSDITLAWNGNATEVVGCSISGCSVAALDLDGDGVDEIVRSGSGVSLAIGGQSQTLQGAGTLSVEDVDGDGADDVLAADQTSGRIYLYRGLTNGLAAPVVMHVADPLDGALSLADMDGDGVPELLYVTGAGTVYSALPTSAGPESSW